jgi:hypothetical protein
MEKDWPTWVVVDVMDTFPDYGIVVAHVMAPLIKWCEDNLGPMRINGICPIWYNDLIYGTWNEIHFSNPEDAALFILTHGGKKVR